MATFGFGLLWIEIERMTVLRCRMALEIMTEPRGSAAYRGFSASAGDMLFGYMLPFAACKKRTS